MGTGESLTASAKVQRLQTALHAKAKEAPGLRFYSLSDKVRRDDVLAVAWQMVRRNGGAAGVDGETVADIEAFGVERWLEELARDLPVRGPTDRERCGRFSLRRSNAGSSVHWAYRVCGIGWRRRRRCWCCRRSSRPTCNRSNMPTGRAEVRMMLSSVCIGC